tara:strand:+ start:3922 stop:4158 length:237 start_codon:yes stop_codon:yes gene_type:complete
MKRNTLDLISKLYFRATEKTIEHDLAKAIELLKSLPDEKSRSSAAAYMDGMSQMRSEWILARRRKKTDILKSPGRKKR